MRCSCCRENHGFHRSNGALARPYYQFRNLFTDYTGTIDELIWLLNNHKVRSTAGNIYYDDTSVQPPAQFVANNQHAMAVQRVRELMEGAPVPVPAVAAAPPAVPDVAAHPPLPAEHSWLLPPRREDVNTSFFSRMFDRHLTEYHKFWHDSSGDTHQWEVFLIPPLLPR